MQGRNIRILQWVLLPIGYFIKNSEAPPQTEELMRNIYGWRGEAMQDTGYLMLVGANRKSRL
jgi:hypothetical protein